ncbi:MAG: MFS transporter [Geodermatophilaceae bacterium]
MEATRALNHPLGGRRAWLVWGVGVLAYVVAIFHRYSLGVAGIEAADRFGISASLLAVFSVVQLGVYAAMQIPAGVLLDRFGSTRLLVSGAVLMGAGQLVFAVAGGMGTALLARVLLGLGDALTFVSVLRLVVLWFPPRQNPIVVQLTGLLGQLGAIASAIPLIGALDSFGWTPTFVTGAALSLAVSVAVVVVMRDSPYAGAAGNAPVSAADLRRSLRETWAEPGTKLGFWTHFVTQFPAVAFALLWGYPFLVSAEGLSPGTAGGLLTLLVLSAMACGPLLGYLVGRFPFHRSRLVLGIVVVSALTWAVVLAWPGRVPLPLLVVLILSMAPNTPGSMIAFDYARTFNPPARIGSASGIVNVGGFTASLVVIIVVGVIVDALSGSTATDAYRWAFAAQFPVWLLGGLQVMRWRRRARARMAERDPAAFAALRAGRMPQSPST